MAKGDSRPVQLQRHAHDGGAADARTSPGRRDAARPGNLGRDASEGAGAESASSFGCGAVGARGPLASDDSRRKPKPYRLWCTSCPGWPVYEGIDAAQRLSAHYQESHS